MFPESSYIGVRTQPSGPLCLWQCFFIGYTFPSTAQRHFIDQKMVTAHIFITEGPLLINDSMTLVVLQACSVLSVFHNYM